MSTNRKLHDLVIIGDTGTGKTTLYKLYTKQKKDERYKKTQGAEFYSRDFDFEKDKITLRIWDTTGDPDFLPQIHSVIKDANAFMLVFDLTDKTSFESLAGKIEILKKNFTNKGVNIMPALILVGTKADEIKPKVEQALIDDFAKNHGCEYIATSAKENQNVDVAFEKGIEYARRHGKALAAVSQQEPIKNVAFTRFSMQVSKQVDRLTRRFSLRQEPSSQQPSEAVPPKNFLRRHWWKILLGIAIVGGLAALAILVTALTGGVAPVVAGGVIAGGLVAGAVGGAASGAITDAVKNKKNADVPDEKEKKEKEINLGSTGGVIKDAGIKPEPKNGNNKPPRPPRPEVKPEAHSINQDQELGSELDTLDASGKRRPPTPPPQDAKPVKQQEEDKSISHTKPLPPIPGATDAPAPTDAPSPRP